MDLLYAFFLLSMAAVIAGAVCAVIGYDLWNDRRVENLWEYTVNFFSMLTCYTGGGLFVLWLYVQVFGWPQPD